MVTKVTTLPLPHEIEFEFARGAHVGIVKLDDGFEPRVKTNWEDFIQLVTTFTVSDSKVGPYVCRPMGGDGSRSDANALPWPLLPLDVDELLPEELNDLERWCATQNLDLVLATTYSHTLENPRIRLWVRCGRAFSATEHLFLFKAFSQATFFPFKLDPATAKPSQPIYLPRCPDARKHLVFAHYYAGLPLDVDGLLQIYQREMRERAQRNEGGRFSEGRGVRTPGGMVDAFNKHFDLPALLEAHGYKQRTRNRYVAPGSKSGRAAVVVHDWGLISFHDPDHDRLSLRNDLNQPRVLDPFAVFAVLEHDDQFLPAWKSASNIVKQRGWSSDESIVEDEDELYGYKIFGAYDAFMQLTPREMIITEVLEKQSRVLVTGQSSSGKSTVIEYLAFCVATGRDFGSHKTVPGRILWIAGEDAYNTQLRIGALCDKFGESLRVINDQFLIMPQAIAVLDSRSIAAFHKVVAKTCGEGASFSLVVVDSKSVCWGGEDENSNDENALFVRLLGDHFLDHYGASVILIHHLTKHKEKEEQSARGASALLNNMEQEWRFDMLATSSTSVMSPGGKLRMARWDDMRFAIEAIELDRFKHTHLVNSMGDAPKVSIVTGPATTAAISKQQSEDVEIAQLLRVLVGLDDKQRHRQNISNSITQALGKIATGMSGADIQHQRSWARYRLAKLEEQRLVERKKDHVTHVTQAGRAFLEAMESAQAMSDEAAPEASEAPEAPEVESENGENENNV